jgi:hypothetical protein
MVYSHGVYQFAQGGACTGPRSGVVTQMEVEKKVLSKSAGGIKVRVMHGSLIFIVLGVKTQHNML